jgi:hypothetical protein
MLLHPIPRLLSLLAMEILLCIPHINPGQ